METTDWSKNVLFKGVFGFLFFQNDVDRNVAILKHKDEEITKAIQNMTVEEEVNIDEAIVASCPLYKQ